jgi:DNA-binding protein H-NS
MKQNAAALLQGTAVLAGSREFRMFSRPPVKSKIQRQHMAIELDSLNFKQLTDLIARAQKRLDSMQSERVGKARAKLANLAKAEGYTIEELFGGAKKGRGKAKAKTTKVKRVVKPKYRNPANAAETWSGRGKRPRWFNAALSAGKKDKDLLIG